MDIALPANTPYIHLAASFPLAQGVAYWFVFRNMARNVDIVKLGLFCKVLYVVVVVYYVARDVPIIVAFGWFLGDGASLAATALTGTLAAPM